MSNHFTLEMIGFKKSSIFRRALAHRLLKYSSRKALNGRSDEYMAAGAEGGGLSAKAGKGELRECKWFR